MNQTTLLVVVISTLASALSIIVAAATIGRTLIAVTNSINNMNAQTSNNVASLASQFQVHITESSGKFEMLEYKLHSNEQQITHKASRLLGEIEKQNVRIDQLEGFLAKNHDFKRRNREN